MLLLAGLAATAAAAVQAYRAVASERALAERALEDFAGFVAWSFRMHMRDGLRYSVEQVLGPVNHGEGLHMGHRYPPASDLVHYMEWDESCYCHVPPELGPIAFFAFELDSDSLAVAVNRYPQPERGWLVDTTEARLHGPPMVAREIRPYAQMPAGYSPPELAALNETLARHVREQWPTDWGYGLILARIEGIDRILAYRPMATSIGDTVVYAVEYATSDMSRFLTGITEAETLLPEPFTTPLAESTGRGNARKLNRYLIDVEVVDGEGRVLFASDSAADWSHDAFTALPASFGLLGVRAQIRPSAANLVLAGGLPQSRLPFLIGLLVLAAALSLVALGQLRREAELAHLRSDFVASVSHELRTPLAQIRLFLETLRLGRARTERDRSWSFENLERETTRLTHLVENVLQFGRTTHGGAAIALTPSSPTDVAAEVRATVEGFRPLAGARATIRLQDVEEPVMASVHPDAVRQVLLNLLDNAVKYGPRGQNITVRVKGDSAGVQLVVDDEGPGIPDADRGRIWEPFVRGSNGATRAMGGSGIGLTVVRDVARRYGGDASCTSAPEGGARFTVRFPVHGPEPKPA